VLAWVHVCADLPCTVLQVCLRSGLGRKSSSWCARCVSCAAQQLESIHVTIHACHPHSCCMLVRCEQMHSMVSTPCWERVWLCRVRTIIIQGQLGCRCCWTPAKLLQREEPCSVTSVIACAADSVCVTAPVLIPSPPSFAWRAQVDGCGAHLGAAKAYYQRHKVCAVHLSAMCSKVNGVDSRFCQQCGKFQPLEDFDADKRYATAAATLPTLYIGLRAPASRFSLLNRGYPACVWACMHRVLGTSTAGHAACMTRVFQEAMVLPAGILC
jgi:hypothetical protein